MKIRKLVIAVSSLLALIFVAGACLVAVSLAKINGEKEFIENAVYDEAVISRYDINKEGEKEYYISFKGEGNVYEFPYKSDSDTKVGDTLHVYFEKANPENYRIIDAEGNDYKTLRNAGIAVCVISVVLGIAVFIPEIIRLSLIKNGKWVMCKVIKVKKGKLFSRIHCDSSKFSKMNGQPFISNIIESKLPDNIKGRSVRVYYKEKHPGIYYVDTGNFN